MENPDDISVSHMGRSRTVLSQRGSGLEVESLLSRTSGSVCSRESEILPSIDSKPLSAVSGLRQQFGAASIEKGGLPQADNRGLIASDNYTVSKVEGRHQKTRQVHQQIDLPEPRKTRKVKSLPNSSGSKELLGEDSPRLSGSAPHRKERFPAKAQPLPLINTFVKGELSREKTPFEDVPSRSNYPLHIHDKSKIADKNKPLFFETHHTPQDARTEKKQTNLEPTDNLKSKVKAASKESTDQNMAKRTEAVTQVYAEGATSNGKPVDIGIFHAKNKKEKTEIPSEVEERLLKEKTKDGNTIVLGVTDKPLPHRVKSKPERSFKQKEPTLILGDSARSTKLKTPVVSPKVNTKPVQNTITMMGAPEEKTVAISFQTPSDPPLDVYTLDDHINVYVNEFTRIKTKVTLDRQKLKSRAKSGKRKNVYTDPMRNIPPWHRKEYILNKRETAMYKHISEVYGNEDLRQNRQNIFYRKILEVQLEEWRRLHEDYTRKELRKNKTKEQQMQELKRLREKFEDEQVQRFRTQYVTNRILEHEWVDRHEYGLPDDINDEPQYKARLQKKGRKPDIKFSFKKYYLKNKRKYDLLFASRFGPDLDKNKSIPKMEGIDILDMSDLHGEEDTGHKKNRKVRVVDIVQDAEKMLYLESDDSLDDGSDEDESLYKSPRMGSKSDVNKSSRNFPKYTNNYSPITRNVKSGRRARLPAHKAYGAKSKTRTGHINHKPSTHKEGTRIKQSTFNAYDGQPNQTIARRKRSKEISTNSPIKITHKQPGLTSDWRTNQETPHVLKGERGTTVDGVPNNNPIKSFPSTDRTSKGKAPPTECEPQKIANPAGDTPSTGLPKYTAHATSQSAVPSGHVTSNTLPSLSPSKNGPRKNVGLLNSVDKTGDKDEAEVTPTFYRAERFLQNSDDLKKKAVLSAGTSENKEDSKMNNRATNGGVGDSKDIDQGSNEHTREHSSKHARSTPNNGQNTPADVTMTSVSKVISTSAYQPEKSLNGKQTPAGSDKPKPIIAKGMTATEDRYSLLEDGKNEIQCQSSSSEIKSDHGADRLASNLRSTLNNAHPFTEQSELFQSRNKQPEEEVVINKDNHVNSAKKSVEHGKLIKESDVQMSSKEGTNNDSPAQNQHPSINSKPTKSNIVDNNQSAKRIEVAQNTAEQNPLLSNKDHDPQSRKLKDINTIGLNEHVDDQTAHGRKDTEEVTPDSKIVGVYSNLDSSNSLSDSNTLSPLAKRLARDGTGKDVPYRRDTERLVNKIDEESANSMTEQPTASAGRAGINDTSSLPNTQLTTTPKRTYGPEKYYSDPKSNETIQKEIPKGVDKNEEKVNRKYNSEANTQQSVEDKSRISRKQTETFTPKDNHLNRETKVVKSGPSKPDKKFKIDSIYKKENKIPTRAKKATREKKIRALPKPFVDMDALEEILPKAGKSKKKRVTTPKQNVGIVTKRETEKRSKMNRKETDRDHLRSEDSMKKVPAFMADEERPDIADNLLRVTDDEVSEDEDIFDKAMRKYGILIDSDSD